MVTKAKNKPQGELGEVVVVDDADVLQKLTQRMRLVDSRVDIRKDLKPIEDEIKGINEWLNTEYPATKFTNGEKYRVGPFLLEASQTEAKQVEFERGASFKVKVSLASTS